MTLKGSDQFLVCSIGAIVAELGPDTKSKQLSQGMTFEDKDGNKFEIITYLENYAAVLLKKV